ncbi:radical SAM protein [Candidatus Woesearchaeota archaeon]|nr:radical SAM protein [Candidatus Woesearchaeota archaeon]
MQSITSTDGTIKLEYDGYTAVIIPSKNEKYTVCVSSQSGCPVGCTFCHTGKFRRNLNSEEIIGQFSDAAQMIGQNPTALVCMGMGEPMLNFKAVSAAIEAIHTKFNLAYRHITLSTVGYHLNRLIDVPYNIAVSVHASTQELRDKLIPHAAGLQELVRFSHQHRGKNGIMVQYTLIDSVNDTDEDARRLAALDWAPSTNFNIIEYNEKGTLKKSPHLVHFKEIIRNTGYKCFVRMSRGADIEAACGMLDH